MSELHSNTQQETGDAPRQSARRRFLAGATAAGAAALMAGTGRAFATAHHHTWQYSGLMAAAETCMAKGHACLNHCINTFKGGDTSLASCAVAVQETIAACNALAQLSASNSAHTKAFANVIDLADVTDMRDSGLNWLIMFCQWARRSGARVRVVHARPAIAYRLLAAGIAHEPAWLVDPRPAVVDVRDGSLGRVATVG